MCVSLKNFQTNGLISSVDAEFVTGNVEIEIVSMSTRSLGGREFSEHGVN